MRNKVKASIQLKSKFALSNINPLLIYDYGTSNIFIDFIFQWKSEVNLLLVFDRHWLSARLE